MARGPSHGGFRRFSWDERYENRHECGDQRWNSKELAPFILADGPDSNREPGENERRQVVNCDLSELDHEAEYAGESAALAAVEPSRVDFDHSRRAERLKITVEQPDQGECRKRSGERSEPINEVDSNRAGRTDNH